MSSSHVPQEVVYVRHDPSVNKMRVVRRYRMVPVDVGPEFTVAIFIDRSDDTAGIGDNVQTTPAGQFTSWTAAYRTLKGLLVDFENAYSDVRIATTSIERLEGVQRVTDLTVEQRSRGEREMIVDDVQKEDADKDLILRIREKVKEKFGGEG